MSLLTICQRVMSVTGWPRISSISSNLEPTAQQIFGCANDELEELSEKFKWPQLQEEYTFSAVQGQSLYPLPNDFRVMEPDAIFSTDEYYRVRGSTSLEYWQLYKYGKLGNLGRKRFRMHYDLAGIPQIEITPTPDEAENFTCVYYSNMYARNDNNDPVPLFAADTDTSKIPERLVQLGVKWRFRRAKGLDYSAERLEYERAVSQQYAQYAAEGFAVVGGKRLFPDDYAGLTYGYVPESGFGA